MAWKSKGEQDAGEWTGFLDKGVKVEGTLNVVGTFRFDAEMKGTIISTESLLLGDNAKLEGQIEGNHVTVAGRVEGIIRAKGRVEIQPKGIVAGEIFTPCLVIDAGGMFDGRCHMSGASTKEASSLTIPLRAAAQT